MIILIPFALLKLRKNLEKERSPENLAAFKKLIMDDIMGNINLNEQLGNITKSDAAKLRSLTQRLYEHIYSHYEEMKELNDMTDETILLDIDIMEIELEKMEQKIVEKENTIAQKNLAISEKDSEIARLKKQLEQLQNKQ